MIGMLRTFAATTSRHPRRTLLAVLAFVLVAGAVGGPLAGSLKSSGGFDAAGSDSQLATHRLQRATGLNPDPVALIVATPHGARAAAPRIVAVARRLAAVPGIAGVRAPAAVARDGREALVVGLQRAAASSGDVAKATISAFAGAHGVTVGGSAVANEQVGSTVTKDLGIAELLAMPLLILLSIVFFRGRAALMPLAAGLTTVLGSFLVLTAVNHVYGLSVYALNLVIGMGLGLSIDYALFIVTRFREELSAGAEVPAAIATAIDRAGRAVLFSATTVALALATLTVFPLGFAISMGIAGSITALVAAGAALVVSPALLGLWGAKLAPAPTGAAAESRWYRLASAVMRRPAPVAILTALVMIAVALPALGTHWTPIDTAVIPRGESSRTVADALAREFGGAGETPISTAIIAPPGEGAAVRAFASRVDALPGVRNATRPVYRGRDTWQLDVGAAGDPAGPLARRLVRAIRGLPAPFRHEVTGDAAAFVDQQSAISGHLPLAVGLLAALTFVVLWLMTGSIVLPLKALVMNALTVGAALSPLTLIYGHGRLTGLLGYTPNGGVEPTDFLVAATVVFALSTDYGVFLLARIKEAFDAGAGTREAVARGLGRTGRVVTAAAILLAVAIGAFATSSISFIQQIGLATATGVLIDAFIVRSLLVPSLMALLGRANWFSPAPLRRLHERIAPGEVRHALAAPVDAPA